MKPATQNTRPLLVVDDDPNNRDLLSRRLSRAGYQVQSAEGAQEALRKLQSAEYDLVLLDSMMPGMSGVDLLRLLRGTHSPEELPVIMVTALVDSDRVVEALSAGANDYITKPIDFSVALARVRTQLDRKRAEDALRESEQRYSLAARGANDGLWDWDLRTGKVFYSPRWHEMLGLQQPVSGTPADWLDRIHPEDRPRVEFQLETLWHTRACDFVSEHRIRHADGSYRWMLLRGHVLRSPTGTGIRMAGSQTDVTENKAFDSLTGLPNRVLLRERLSRGLESLRSGRTAYAGLLFIDIDRFKVINDSLGHAVGDQLLIQFAALLQETLAADPSSAAGDTLVARLGGDEFAIFLDLKDPREAMFVAQRIQESTQRRFDIEGREVFASVSIGVVVADKLSASPDALLRDADTAMYRAKALGRSRCEMFSAELRDAALGRLEMENDLRKAIEDGQFTVYYQSKVVLNTGCLVGFEALVRWNHPRRGLISPCDFIPIAEETGLINRIGSWVMMEACKQMRAWQARYPTFPPLEVSVNLSPRQFRDASLISTVKHVLKETGLEPACLQLEVTESVLIDDAEEAIRTLVQLKDLGVGLKLDDFGTGYSSLNYLCRLPCDSLKIDRSFVRSMCEDDNSLQVIRAILSLAQSLGKTVVAEGIDCSVHVARLRDLGCEFGQGYFFSLPIPPSEASRLIEEMSQSNVPSDSLPIS